MKARIRRKTFKRLKEVESELNRLAMSPRRMGKSGLPFSLTTKLIGKYLKLKNKLKRYS